MNDTHIYNQSIQSALQTAFNWFAEDYAHETQPNYVPYGNTYVNAGDQPTDESEERCLGDFKEGLDVDQFVREFLLENDEFRALIETKIQGFRG